MATWLIHTLGVRGQGRPLCRGAPTWPQRPRDAVLPPDSSLQAALRHSPLLRASARKTSFPLTPLCGDSEFPEPPAPASTGAAVSQRVSSPREGLLGGPRTCPCPQHPYVVGRPHMVPVRITSSSGAGRDPGPKMSPALPHVNPALWLANTSSQEKPHHLYDETQRRAYLLASHPSPRMHRRRGPGGPDGQLASAGGTQEHPHSTAHRRWEDASRERGAERMHTALCTTKNTHAGTFTDAPLPTRRSAPPGARPLLPRAASTPFGSLNSIGSFPAGGPERRVTTGDADSFRISVSSAARFVFSCTYRCLLWRERPHGRTAGLPASGLLLTSQAQLREQGLLCPLPQAGLPACTHVPLLPVDPACPLVEWSRQLPPGTGNSRPRNGFVPSSPPLILRRIDNSRINTFPTVFAGTAQPPSRCCGRGPEALLRAGLPCF